MKLLLIRKNPTIYRAYRLTLMFFKRYRYGLQSVHPTFFMSGKSIISRDLIAKEYSFVGHDCYIGPQVELGPYVMLAPKVAIVGGDHRFDKPGVPMIFSGRPELKKTIVEADSWIGYGAIIKAGVRIGRGSIVAAGSVVTKDVFPYHIVGGIPARIIGNRFKNEEDKTRHDVMLSEPAHEGSYCMNKTIANDVS